MSNTKIELNTIENSSYFNNIRDVAYNYFISKGILMRPLGNIIYLLPPYCISDEQLDYVYKEILAFLQLID